MQSTEFHRDFVLQIKDFCISNINSYWAFEGRR